MNPEPCILFFIMERGTARQRNLLKPLAGKALNVLLPPRCITCRTMVERPGALCASCWNTIDFLQDVCCELCDFPLESDAMPGSLCGHCIMETPPYDHARAVFKYDDKSRKLITHFKYGDKLQALHLFAEWMSRKGREFFTEGTILIPVPLHPIRLFRRRYNQSALLANAIGKRAGLPVAVAALRRIKHNPPQAGLSRKERLRNVKGAFTLNARYKQGVAGKNIILVDDVVTTGATAKECAKVLKRAGAATVTVLTLARTVE